MRFRSISMSLIGALTALSLASCNGSGKDDGPIAKAVFYLEGGVCQTNDEKVTYIYDMKERTETYIADPFALDDKAIERAGYNFDGWYRIKNESGGDVTYSDPWDFQKDKMTMAGVELYAKWNPNIVYSYDLYYKDENGQDQFLYSYPVSAGKTFEDYQNKADGRDGYTLIGFSDENGEPWNDSFVHPGGETDTAIKVYAEYIEGDYKVVRTKNDLRTVTGTDNVYLAADLDLEGGSFGFEKYMGDFRGNGHTISNFKIAYSANASGTVYLGVFGILEDAKVSDLTLTGATISVKTVRSDQVYIGSIAGNVINSTISGVSLVGSCTVKEDMTRAVEWNAVDGVITDPYYSKDDASIVIDTTSDFAISDLRPSTL